MTTPHTAPTPAPGEVYAARLAARNDDQIRLARRYGVLSGWRRLLLAMLVVLIILVEKEGWLAKLALLGLPALALEFLVNYRTRVTRALRDSRWFAVYYQRRIACCEDRWVGTGEPGTRYLEPDHPAAADLDLFGVGGLFERLSIPCTRAGEDTLAAWLLTPASAAVARERQAAVAELRDRDGVREELAYLADQIVGSADFAQVVRWGQAEPVLVSPAIRYLGAFTILLTVAAVFSGLYLGTGIVPVLIALGVQAAFALALRRQATAVLGAMEERGYDLGRLAGLFARLERESFTAPLLVRLQAELTAGHAARRTAWLNRLHLAIPFALLVVTRPQMAMWLERWRRAHGIAFGRWLGVLGEIEALCALGTYSHECPDDPFPEILDAGTVFDAEGLGHPLFSQARCVRNDLSLGEAGVSVLLVSGSNMSGKSTLLRAAGVNVCLALAGAPVRARRLRLAPLVVGATLRIQDSLLAGRSRFYAEVLRVRRLLEMAQGTPPLLFLLDELFGGTNSADRRMGAEAVIRQLVDAGAIGLVTTHDLALTDLAEQLAGRAANAHFDDRFDNGELIFDYQMKPGVVQHTNGVALMRAVGIVV